MLFCVCNVFFKIFRPILQKVGLLFTLQRTDVEHQTVFFYNFSFSYLFVYYLKYKIIVSTQKGTTVDHPFIHLLPLQEKIKGGIVVENDETN